MFEYTGAYGFHHFNPTLFDKPIEETGQFTSEGLYFNTSSVLTELIQAAGRFCERFASDLFIDWKAVERDIENRTPDTPPAEFLFGFRENGVDHAEYIFARFHENKYLAEANYRRIYKLCIETPFSPSGYGLPKMTLRRVEVC